MRPGPLRNVTLWGAFWLLAGAALAERHTDDELHYAFQVPYDWVRVPDEVLAEASEAMYRQAGVGPRPIYTAAYQAPSDTYFSHPYLLVQHHPLDTATVRKIAAALESEELEADVQKLIDSGMARSIEFGEPVADAARRVVFLSFTSEIDGVGRIRGFSMAAPGRDGTVELNFYALADDYDLHLPVFEAVVDSFAFDRGYEYQWTVALARAAAPVGSILRRALVAAVVAGLVGLLAKLRRDRIRGG